MPKQKKKLKTGRGSATASNSKSDDNNSEFNADENASTISNASTNMSYQQDLDSEDQGAKPKTSDETVEKIDDFEGQINKCLDGLLEKGFKEREDSLKLLKKMLSNKYLVNHLEDKRYTLTEGLLKCLKKGKTNEQLLACDVLMLTFIQFGYISSEVSSLLTDSKQTLVEFIDDEKVEPEVRAACAKTYALAVFITNEASYDVAAVLDKLESLFASSYAKGDGTLRTFSPKVYELHSTALSAWCLLLCIMPLSYVNKLAQKHLVHFQDFLKSPDVDLRIAAGETIALLFELAQCDPHADLKYYEDENLFETIKNLANDSAKYRSKKDKKQQRSSFRDILKTIEEGEFESQTIKFSSETLFLDNWVRRKEYETFKEILSTGMNSHLQQNDFVREMFDLGAPLLNNDSSRKANMSGMSRFQKTQFNKEQFRSRTKSMNKKRETKDTIVAEEED